MAYGSSLQQQVYYSSPFFVKQVIASIYGWRERRERHGKFYRQHLQSLLQSQWYTDGRLKEIQFRRVKEFLVQTARQSRFCQKRFRDHGLDPAALRSVADLSVLPILDKQTVRQNLREVIPDNLAQHRPRWVHTSGTTGTGLRFPISSECFQREYAFRALHYRWGGIQEGERYAFCSGHPVAYHDRHQPPFWTHDYANNWLLLSSYHLSERNLPRYIEELERFGPVLLAGYPSSLYLLALANDRANRRVHPRAVYTASETLFEFQRQAIEASFGCKVYMWYGNTEMCGNIVECERGRHHLKFEHSYVELLGMDERPSAPGQEGRLVCTGFGNLATPLIRYDVGDIAVRSSEEVCTCGRGGMLIDRVVGRTEDYVRTPDGRLVGRLDHLFKDAVHVKNAQIIQDELDKVMLRIVKDHAYTERDEKEILSEARMRLGSSISIEFDYVDEIARTKTGKFRFIISRVKDADAKQRVTASH